MDNRGSESESVPFGRRTVLTSAVAAGVVTPLVGAGDAQADAPPAGPGDGSVARLLAVPESGRGVRWIKAALQVAVELELATIPPYLCGWWSVRDRTSEAALLIRRIIDDEMYHMGIVCNLLAAVGGRPQIKKAAPNYPGPLPGGVRAGVIVYLSGLTRSSVHDVMMAIEAPEHPVAMAEGRTPSPTIGAFYGELLRAFQIVQPALTLDGQLSAHIGHDPLAPVATLDDVEKSIDIVREQGEGTSSSPDDAFGDDYPAHYYAFGEIYHGRRLQQVDDTWAFTGDPIPFPDVRPMARVPRGGWKSPSPEVAQLLATFDSTYHDVLSFLEAAWSGGGASSLNAAVHSMFGLQATALQLMETPLPDRPGNYGPQFSPPAAG